MNVAVESFALQLGAAGRSSDLRQAALLLHTVAPADRAWLLAQLPGVQREALETLLGELVELAIPSAPELLEAVVADLPASRAVPADALESALEATDPALLAGLLAGEPDGLVARLFGMRQWHVTGPVLARLGTGQRQRVLGLLAAEPRPAADAPMRPRTLLEDAVLKRVVARIRVQCAADDDARRGAHPPRRAEPRSLLEAARRWWRGGRRAAPRGVEPRA